ncbi:DMT family transporter [bacterium]|nr:DMT family transporter [bacterium]
MTWFILSILSGLSFALARAISRIYLKKQGNTLAFTAIHGFIAGLILLPIIFIGLHWPTQSITWWYFAGIIILAFTADWLTFSALKTINVSTYQIVNQARHIFILISGLILFAEAIVIDKLLAIIFITIGVIIALYKKVKIDRDKGIILAILSTLANVLALIFVKFAIRDFSEIAIASLELMAVGLLGFILMKFNTNTLLKEFKINKWGLILAGLFFGFSEIFLFIALKTGEISKVIPVAQSSLIFGLLIGIIFMNERENLIQKIIGASIIISGIILLN